MPGNGRGGPLLVRALSEGSSRNRTSEAPTVLAPLPSDDRLIPAAELPRFIGLAVQTLARLRCEGNGPPFVKIGRLIYYRASDVRDWLAQRRYSNTLYIGTTLQHSQQLRCPK